MNKLTSTEIINKKQQALDLFKKSSFSKAIDLLNQIILEDKVKDPMSFFLLGTSYLHERDLELAEKNLKISIDKNKSSMSFFFCIIKRFNSFITFSNMVNCS